ncbi:MAG: adenylyltransferase/cytidyltransferase family protein, partial [Muribaculaceae bacterium]|nr:adenylyltransferase/cytidyltransferase family protein [Muribaculaceae bacterium]
MKAIFPGSFDPFTIGHLDIVARALKVAEEVIIAIGINPAKYDARELDQNVETLEQLFQDCPRLSVMTYSGLTVDAARKAGANLIIRG